MPVKIGTLLKNLGNKVKLDLTDSKYIDLLSSNLEIPDDVASALENGLLDLDTAKNHGELDKHFRAKALNGVDAKIKELAEEGDLSPEAITEILGEKNSYAKITLLKGKLKEALEAKHAGSGDTKAIKAEVAKLNNDILALKSSKDSEISKIKSESEQAILDYAVESHLASLPYANSDISTDINVMTAKNIVNKALAENKAKLVRVDGKLKLVNSEAPDLDYLKDNKAVSFSDFSTSTLASNKLLKVSDANASQGAPRNTPKNNQDGNQPDTSNLVSAIDKQLAEMGAGY